MRFGIPVWFLTSVFLSQNVSAFSWQYTLGVHIPKGVIMLSSYTYNSYTSYTHTTTYNWVTAGKDVFLCTAVGT